MTVPSRLSRLEFFTDSSDVVVEKLSAMPTMDEPRRYRQASRSGAGIVLLSLSMVPLVCNRLFHVSSPSSSNNDGWNSWFALFRTMMSKFCFGRRRSSAVMKLLSNAILKFKTIRVRHSQFEFQRKINGCQTLSAQIMLVVYAYTQ